MFNRKAKSTIDSLIGSSTSIEGDVRFKGGLRIDGNVKGNVVAEAGETSVLVISESAKVEGDVRVAWRSEDAAGEIRYDHILGDVGAPLG